MKKALRDGKTWFIAETDQERKNLTRIAQVLAESKLPHSVIYNDEQEQENPVVKELSY